MLAWVNTKKRKRKTFLCFALKKTYAFYSLSKSGFLGKCVFTENYFFSITENGPASRKMMQHHGKIPASRNFFFPFSRKIFWLWQPRLPQFHGKCSASRNFFQHHGIFFSASRKILFSAKQKVPFSATRKIFQHHGKWSASRKIQS